MVQGANSENVDRFPATKGQFDAALVTTFERVAIFLHDMRLGVRFSSTWPQPRDLDPSSSLLGVATPSDSNLARFGRG